MMLKENVTFFLINRSNLRRDDHCYLDFATAEFAVVGVVLASFGIDFDAVFLCTRDEFQSAIAQN